MKRRLVKKARTERNWGENDRITTIQAMCV